jgi:sorbitol-specific phosphotransferase system component IIC
VNAKGGFQDLNFEEANPVSVGSPYPPAYVTTVSAFPGWQAYYGTTPTSIVVYNGISLGATEISLVGPAAESYVIDGTYSALLQGFGEEATLRRCK